MAYLGPGVLVIGQSKIGKNTCSGSSTTIINTSMEPGTTIEAGSLIGDTSCSFSAVISNPLKETKLEINRLSPNHNNLVSEASIEMKLRVNRPIDNDLIYNSNNFYHNPQTTKEKKANFSVEDIENICSEKVTKIEKDTEITKQSNQDLDQPIETQIFFLLGQIYANNLLGTLFPER